MIYLATTLTNADRALDLYDKLAACGVGITYKWTQHGRVSDMAVLDKIAENEIRGIVEARCVFVVMPGKFGTFWEFGLAYGLRKPIVMLLDQYTGPNEPVLRLRDVTYFDREDEALAAVAKLDADGAVTHSHLIDQIAAETTGG